MLISAVPKVCPGAGKKKSTKPDRKDISNDGGAVPDDKGYGTEHFLVHSIMRADVEHIDISIYMKGEIQYSCEKAAENITECTPLKRMRDICAFQMAAGIYADKDEKDMPPIGVECQGQIAIMHTARIEKGEDTA